MSGEKVKELGVKPIARFVGFKAVGVDPKLWYRTAYAIPEVLKQADLDVSDIDLVELNEAFASQTLASMREVGLDTEKTNVNGGAIALGHPLGATGAMLVGRLLSEMKISTRYKIWHGNNVYRCRHGRCRHLRIYKVIYNQYIMAVTSYLMSRPQSVDKVRLVGSFYACSAGTLACSLRLVLFPQESA